MCVHARTPHIHIHATQTHSMKSLTYVVDQGENGISELEDNVEQLEHSDNDKDKETTNRAFDIYRTLRKTQIYES